MEVITCSAAPTVLGVFAVLNGLLVGALVYAYRRRKPPDPKPTLGAEDLLHDLLSQGQAILRVEVIDPTNLILRSPRR